MFLNFIIKSRLKILSNVHPSPCTRPHGCRPSGFKNKEVGISVKPSKSILGLCWVDNKSKKNILTQDFPWISIEKQFGVNMKNCHFPIFFRVKDGVSYVDPTANPSIDLCVCLCISWLVPLSVFPSVSLFVHPSVRLSIHH